MSNQFKDIVAGVRLSWSWIGEKKAIRGQISEEMAAVAEADGGSIMQAKKLFGTDSNEWLKKLNSLKAQVTTYYKEHTMPYFEAGVRILSREKYPSLRNRMQEFREQIKEAEQELEYNKQEVLDRAKLKLGKLYNPADYPQSFLGMFDFTFAPANIEIPSYLMELDPKEYERRTQDLEKRLESSYELWESQMAEAFGEMVSNLVDRLTPSPDGKKKRIESASIDNLFAFFDKYQELRSQMKSVKSQGQLDDMIVQAKEVLGDFDAAAMRASTSIRNKVVEGFSAINKSLSEKIITTGKRSITTKAKTA